MQISPTIKITFGVLVLVVGCWIAWASTPNSQNDWRSFDALNVLFSGLAFAALVITVWIQLGEIAAQDVGIQKSLEANRQLVEVLALANLRSFLGGEISHLQTVLDDDTTEKEGISREEAERRIRDAKKQIELVMTRMRTVTQPFLSING